MTDTFDMVPTCWLDGLQHGLKTDDLDYLLLWHDSFRPIYHLTSENKKVDIKDI